MECGCSQTCSCPQSSSEPSVFCPLPGLQVRASPPSLCKGVLSLCCLLMEPQSSQMPYRKLKIVMESPPNQLGNALKPALRATDILLYPARSQLFAVDTGLEPDCTTAPSLVHVLRWIIGLPTIENVQICLYVATAVANHGGPF